MSSSESVQIEFRLLLQEEFSRRIRNNERYSLRAFARHIGINSSTLSQILSGKRAVSNRMRERIAKNLGLSQLSPLSEPVETNFDVIDLDAFAVIADWYHLAILDLTLLKSFRPDARWIAGKLSISSHEAKLAVDRLLRLGLLTLKSGKISKSKKFYTNYSEGISSTALKEYQRQVIKKALLAVDNCPADRKDITSMTIAADSRKIKIAKERIKCFRRDLCAFLETGEKDSVFHLAIQLYPITKFEK